MKKCLSFVLVISLLLTMFAGCTGSTPASSTTESSAAPTSTSSTESAAPAEDKKPTYVMQIGHAQTIDSPRHIATESFKKYVEEKTNGDVIIEIFPAGQLGNETEMTEAVSMGTLQAVRGGELEYLPQITILSLPMLFDNIDEVHKVFDSEFVTGMLGTVETEHNMKVLAVGDDSGFRQITNNKRAIKSPEDMKGLKMRTVLEIMDLSMKAFGASTASIPFTDLYMALKTGVVDGQENPITLIANSKFYEVQTHCTVIDYMVTAEVMYVNLTWYNSLPAEYQTILTEGAALMMTETSVLVEQGNQAYMEEIQNGGCEIYTLTPEERDAFKVPAEEVWKEYVELGRITKEDLDTLLALMGKSVNW